MKKTFFRRSLLITSIGFVFSASALAGGHDPGDIDDIDGPSSVDNSIVIDGKLDDLSQWDHTFSVNFQFDKGETGTGFLALGTQDGTGNQVLYYTVPKQFVDISYGDTSVGWGSDSETGKNHKLKDLIGSDKLEFTVNKDTGGTQKVKFEFKGNVATGSSIIETAATSLMYNKAYADLATTYKDNSPTLDSGKYKDSDFPSPGIADSNSNYVSTDLNGGNSEWIFDVAYEIEFESGIFDATDWANGNLDNLFVNKDFDQHGTHTDLNFIFGGHASPSKLIITSAEYTPCDPNTSGQDPNCGPGNPGGPGNPVPVPGTIWLMLAGLIGFYKTRIKS
ncbi:MAG: PEP-CTERM sorting domain-containing protein [Gammaproteobacteria bacterium]|nr:PEP-CTERM sorting domain-containing protein [Gammaproteobacteria bacterium]